MLIVSKVLLNGYDVIIIIKSVKNRKIQKKAKFVIRFSGIIWDANLSQIQYIIYIIILSSKQIRKRDEKKNEKKTEKGGIFGRKKIYFVRKVKKAVFFVSFFVI